ncbi:ABC transporter ATP-binding protein [Ruminococcus flavefaciens]|uniref:ABC transporter ATP-binding protein n=1 Tax=Ruminococcus flavefaciens TaxID=1265 RepID=UPI0026EF4711|nr:ABC transporter ATP-binding protein [Ruminococcus flavefaciens]MDD7515827.1 ABC transporter ATP-binding protein [Ruminococcus flavefaciens]MDY5691908.1 ABC transporter ATP-binding protein [Ruminococcus flavefaciens]
MEDNIILKTEKLKKEYGEGENAFLALNDVNLEVRQGEFVAVTGESGSGKTTLLNCIGSLDRPTSGTIIFNGKDITKLDDNGLSAYRRKSIGFIFQAFNLIPVLNVEENIVLPLNLDNTPPDKEFLDELLKLTGLDAKRNNYPHELSGGQQQRVAFARALIHKPKLILADEPTGNLDSKNSREIISILKNSIKKYNQTLILITHDGSIAAQADRICRITDGVLSE